jgi:hypothetical protein
MSRQHYPQICYGARGKRRQCQMLDCENITTQTVEIRTSYNDDVFRICNDCRNKVKDHKGNVWFEAKRIYEGTGNYVGEQ